MNTVGRSILIALLSTIVLGCGQKNEEPEGVIPEGYKSAVNKAEDVEGLLQDTNKKHLEEMD